ncbi:MAG: SMC family ATPase [Gemmatimonadaceae bacterium]|nr:SMC family ATPase [Gemmatimonadaceae bacterium]
MKLRSLSLQNFRQHADTRLVFDEGLTGIIGPNGAGKSTILEAIAWSLYGTPAARGQRDGIKWHGAAPRASVRVELVFDLGTHRYRVVRGLTQAELFVDGAPAPIANSSTAVTAVLAQRLGMQRDEFFNTYFTGQKELAAMANLGPVDRAKFLSRVLGYDRLREAQESIRARRKELLAALQELDQLALDPAAVAEEVKGAEALVTTATTARDAAEREAVDAQAMLAKAEPAWRAAEEARARDASLRVERARLEGEATRAQHDAERAEAAVGEAERVAAQLDGVLAQLAPLAALRAELRQLDDASRAAERAAGLRAQRESLLRDQARDEARLAQIAGAPALLAEVRTQLAAARQARDAARSLADKARVDWQRDRQEAQTRREERATQWRETKEQRDAIAVLGTEAPCPVCARPLGEKFTTMLEELDDRLATLRVDGTFFKQRYEQLQAAPADVQSTEERARQAEEEVRRLEGREARGEETIAELERLRPAVATRAEQLAATERDLAAAGTTYDGARHDAVRTQVATLGALELRSAAERAIVDDLGARRTRRDAAMGALATAREAEAQARAAFEAHGFAAPAHEAARLQWETARTRAAAADVARAQAEGEVKSATTTLGAARARMAQVQRDAERRQALRGDRLLHDELDRTYAELREELNARMRPELGELASVFLTDLTDDRYGEFELDDQYRIVLLENGVPKPVISGGEEDVANLALRLAVSQLIAERSGQPFSLLVLDEVFGSLDDTRRANVVELLRRLQDRFAQVIVITHIDAVRDGLDRVIEVRYDEARGCSTVVGGADDAVAEDAPEPLAAGA